MADSPESQVDAPTEPQADEAPETLGIPGTPAGIPGQARIPEPDAAAHQAAPYQATVTGWVSELRARCSAVLAEAAQALAEHTTDLAAGCVTALVIAAGGWLMSAALTLAVWVMAAPGDGSVAAPLHVAGQLWLAAHHVLLQTPDGPFGLSPLGFTVLPVGSLALAGRYVAHRFGAGIWSLGALAVCYPLAALLIAWSAASGSLHAELGAAAGYPCLIACCGYGAGLLSVRAPSLDRWAATAVRAGTGALAVLLGGAALLAALAVCLRFTDVVRLGTAIGQGVAGDGGLFLIDLALVPNLVVWALGFAVGPGFAVGQSTSVSVGGSVHGTLPGLPLVQAVPHSGALSHWMYLAFAVPLAAGTVAVLIIGWSVRGLVDRAAALGAAVPAVGAIAGAGAVLSGGPVAAGAMSAVGPVPWQIALAVLAELGFVAVFGFGLWYAIDYGRGYLDAQPQPVPQPQPLPWQQSLPGVGGGLTDAQHDGPADLVGEGLPALVPERPEEAEQEREVEQVGEVVPDGEPEAEGLAARLPRYPDAEGPLAETGAGAALAEQVEAPDEQDGQDADGEEAVVGAAADGEGVRIDGDGGPGGVGEDEPEAVAGSGDERVEDGAPGPAAP